MKETVKDGKLGDVMHVFFSNESLTYNVENGNQSAPNWPCIRHV